MTHAELKVRVLAAARAAPSPTREQAARSAYGLVAASVVFAAGECAWMAGLPRPAPDPLWTALLALAWLGPALLASWIGLSRGSSMLGRPGPALLASAMLAPLAPWALLALAHRALPGAPPSPPPDDAVCAQLTSAAGLWPLLALAFARRESDPMHPASAGAALGAVTGLWSAALANLWCGSVDLGHIARSHVIAAAGQAALGALLGWAVLALRRHTVRGHAAVLGGAAGCWLRIQADLGEPTAAGLPPRALAGLAAATALGAAAGWLWSAGVKRRD